jgi:thiosulfate dehydrogenase
MKNVENVYQLLKKAIISMLIAFFMLIIVVSILILKPSFNFQKPSASKKTSVVEKIKLEGNLWTPPDIQAVSDNELKATLSYGRDLIQNTAIYFGPKGKLAAISNGMNCQNCHLNGGTIILGNNYSAVASTYPKLRARSGGLESLEKRINDCMERSLNGKPIPNDSKEMNAMVTYIKWLGKDTPKPVGAGLASLPFLDRAASIEKGQMVYQQKCIACHGANGEGVLSLEGNAYVYPPLWGEHSYNVSAGLFRLSRFAGYVKANMPLGATYDSPILTNDEAWDVAAYVNSMPRPIKLFPADWPDISTKPIDHPFGPYIDPFPEEQHKYGPFEPLKKFYDSQSKTN